MAYIKSYSHNNIKVDEEWLLEDPFPGLKGHTFFGYYDKPSFGEKGDLLTHVVSDGVCHIYVQTTSGELVKVAKTNAWNWQQGAMATWLNEIGLF